MVLLPSHNALPRTFIWFQVYRCANVSDYISAESDIHIHHCDSYGDLLFDLIFDSFHICKRLFSNKTPNCEDRVSSVRHILASSRTSCVSKIEWNKDLFIHLNFPNSIPAFQVSWKCDRIHVPVFHVSHITYDNRFKWVIFTWRVKVLLLVMVCCLGKEGRKAE